MTLRIHLCAAALGLLLACSGNPAPTVSQLTTSQLLDPATCQSCHPTQFADWKGSMHAYASDDPLFIAMNQRGQRETDGGLGAFCIQCHAPMAVQLGFSTDGLNLGTTDAGYLKGVTCFFCHSVATVTGTHDNPLVLSFDGGLRGSIKPPEPALISTMPHGGTYSPLLDSEIVTSASMCGPCHDIVNGHGAALERTFQEWEASAFSQDTTGGNTCNQCHMLQSTSLVPISTLPGSPNRELHAHNFPAIDIALIPFANAPAQQQAVQQFLDTSLSMALCVDPTPAGYQIQAYVDNVAAGHKWPSGAAQDRRPWVQLVAADADGGVMYQSGVVPPGTPPTEIDDPDMWMLRDCMFGADGGQVEMFWQAYSTEGNELPTTRRSINPTRSSSRRTWCRSTRAPASSPTCPPRSACRSTFSLWASTCSTTWWPAATWTPVSCKRCRPTPWRTSWSGPWLPPRTRASQATAPPTSIRTTTNMSGA